jgi:hypothetical protein
MLHNNVVKSFERDGFYIAQGLLSPSIISELLENIKSSFDSVLMDFGLDCPNNWQDSMIELFNYDIQKYLSVSASLWRKLKVYDICHHENIRLFIFNHFSWKDIFIPGGQVVHIMSNSLKVPGGYHGISPHQDWLSVKGSLDGLICWIPLMNIDKNLYPLELIPGSHRKKEIFPLKNDPNKPWELDPEFYDDDKFINIDVSIGDVVLMSYFTVHRSSSNGDQRIRLALSTRYDNAHEETFIKRGFPTAYQRVVNR